MIYSILQLINFILTYIGISYSQYLPPYGALFQRLIVDTIGALLIFIAASLTIVVVIYIFRKWMADLQQRIGPNRVGPYGTLQLIADALKMFGKEDIIPDNVDPILFRFAPYLVFIPLIMSYLLIPYGTIYHWAIIFTNVNVTLLLIIAFSAIPPIGEIIAGFASNNKFSLIGALRAAAQDLSYEIPMMISLIGVIMLTGSLNLNTISQYQWHYIPIAILEPIGFLVFFVAVLSKMAVVPFDLPESESELVSGFNVEYSGLRFGIFYLGVFGSIFFGSLFISTVYLGGGSDLPFLPGFGYVWLLIKAFIFTFLFLTIWVSLPRIRVDKYMNFGWKYLLPLSLINLLWTMVLILFMQGVL
ncbi:MAG: NADH-quinone oxidoreductase subunit NuoH [Thermoplasmata archaeon]|jgi:NADH-quinone oxidoreductase subunit H